QVVAGDHLLGHDGRWAVVAATRDSGEWATVYNLRVADHRTYFVGCPEWGFALWAHNYNPYSAEELQAQPALKKMVDDYKAARIAGQRTVPQPEGVGKTVWSRVKATAKSDQEFLRTLKAAGNNDSGPPPKTAPSELRS